MTSPNLPAELRAALNAKLEGLSRNDTAGRAAVISQTYREGGGSGTIRSETDALAYALARMPATYAAVVASYMSGEPDEPERAALADALWPKARDTLLVIEPGTPAGYARIIALRARLIAAGAHVTAPCPHDDGCPLVAPDWCHFSQRLQ